MFEKIAVLGVGAIGSVIGAHLSKAGLDVTLIDHWGQHIDQMKSQGLTITHEDGDSINRNGVLIPINNVQKAWRIGVVLAAGPNCTQVKEGDYICFPNDKGIPVSNLDLDGHGTVANGIFLNEQRIFGVCKRNTSDESKPVNTSESTTRKRGRGKIRSKKS